MSHHPIQLLQFRMSYLAWFGLMLATALLGAGCTLPNTAPGTLEVRVRDHREAIRDFRELRLSLAAVAIHPAGRPRTEGWIEWPPAVRELDLTQYTTGAEAVIIQTPAEAGPYNAVRLTVTQASGTLADGQPAEVKISFETAALNFQIRPSQTTVLGLDLVVFDLSDHPSQGYELHLREAAVQE
jgi:hypothetical protein